MRLTLRTLLAYLDDILEPKQAKELGEKISDSHFATSLINRIREVLRRRRLTAPALSGPGVGLDPNMVAEYLDNTLSPEKVADVEKSCLESDMYLAEVAGCHQILTLVLGEPVDIVPESRERIYALTAPDRAVSIAEPAVESEEQTEHQTAGAAKPKPAEVAARPSLAVEEDDFRKGIPDYLRKPPLWKRMMPYVAVVAVVLLAIAPFMLSRDADPAESQTGQEPANVAALAGQDADNGPEALPLPEQPDEPEPRSQPTTESADASDADAADEFEDKPISPLIAQNDQPAPEGTSGEEFSIDAAPPPDRDIELPSDLPPEVSDVTTDDETVESTVFPPSNTPEAEPIVENLPPLPQDDGQPEPAAASAEDPPAAVDEDQPDSDGETGPELKPAADEQVAVVDTKPKQLTPISEPPQPQQQRPVVNAQYVSRNEIVLIKDPRQDGWRKLAPRSMIHPGDRLVVPEPYNASFRLSEGDTHVTLLPGALNGTSVELTGPSRAADLTLRIHRGRVLFRGDSAGRPDGGEPVKIGLEVAQELWQVKFLTADAVWGLEVTPQQPEDYEQDLGQHRFTGALYVLQGTIQFTDGKGLVLDKSGPDWIPLTAGQRPNINAEGELVEGEPLTNTPQWLKLPKLSRKQFELGRRFMREFDEVQPIGISLVGSVDDRNADIATLGVKCFALAENHSVLADVLRQSEHAQARRAAADGLRDWLPTDPGNREKLKQALAKIYHPEDSEIVYRLLWGIPKGDAQRLDPSMQLVDWMGHESQAIRELAYDQVLRLTGKHRTSNYHPSATTAKSRERALERMREYIARHNGLVSPPQ